MYLQKNEILYGLFFTEFNRVTYENNLAHPDRSNNVTEVTDQARWYATHPSICFHAPISNLLL